MALINRFNEYQLDKLGDMASPVKTSNAGNNNAAAGAIATSVIAGLTDIASGFINAQRAKNAYKFNASMMELQGRMVRLAANIEIKNIRKRAMDLYGKQEALYAKAGVNPYSGSPAAVMANSLKESELDAIYKNIEADYGIAQTQTQAGINRLYAKQESYNATTNAFKSILNTGTQIAPYLLK